MYEQVIEFLNFKNIDIYPPSFFEESDIDIDVSLIRHREYWEYGYFTKENSVTYRYFAHYEQVLFYLIYDKYTNQLQSEISQNISKHSKKGKQNITRNKFSKGELKRLKIMNSELYYLNKYYILQTDPNIDIYEFRFEMLKKLRLYEQTKSELLNFGFNHLLIKEHFRFDLMLHSIEPYAEFDFMTDFFF